MATSTRLTLSQVTRQVADEWAAQGKLSVPPDTDKLAHDDAFWAEVQRRHAEQEEV